MIISRLEAGTSFNLERITNERKRGGSRTAEGQNGCFQLLIMGIQPSQNISACCFHLMQNGKRIAFILEITHNFEIVFSLVVAENVVNGISAELTDTQNAIIYEHG